MFRSFILGWVFLYISLNLNIVAKTATVVERGTVYCIFNSKNMTKKGITDPAPDNPPALDKSINIAMNTRPMHFLIGLDHKSSLLTYRF